MKEKSALPSADVTLVDWSAPITVFSKPSPSQSRNTLHHTTRTPLKGRRGSCTKNIYENKGTYRKLQNAQEEETCNFEDSRQQG